MSLEDNFKKEQAERFRIPEGMLDDTSRFWYDHMLPVLEKYAKGGVIAEADFSRGIACLGLHMFGVFAIQNGIHPDKAMRHAKDIIQNAALMMGPRGEYDDIVKDEDK